jgi:hypothetical protein
MSGPHENESAVIRLLRRLATPGARLVAAEAGWRVQAGDKAAPHKAAKAEPELVDGLRRRGLIAGDAASGLFITPVGSARLRRALAGADGFAAQHQDRAAIVIDDPAGGRSTATVNRDESPLAWLRRHKGRDGRALIGAAEFAAGERFRADYERGAIMPRVTANWSASVASGRRDGSGGMAELTEAALSARIRVDKALAALGPEFGDLLVDFCCFLKGIEEIERNRQWPARSAKLVLKLALAALARHYGLSASAHGRARAAGIRHWGSGDYRPTVD